VSKDGARGVMSFGGSLIKYSERKQKRLEFLEKTCDIVWYVINSLQKNQELRIISVDII
jgi:hypothetical protein